MPAGNLRKLKMAILYGADAVYLGTPDMSLRTKSEFSLEDVIEGVKFCHAQAAQELEGSEKAPVGRFPRTTYAEQFAEGSAWKVRS